MEINILDVSDTEDGGSILAFDADDEAAKYLMDLGMKFILYCEVANTSTKEVLESLIKQTKIDDHASK